VAIVTAKVLRCAQQVEAAGPGVAAGKLNGSKRRAWTHEDIDRLRRQCLERQPWQHATGPRTADGKQRSASNGNLRRRSPESVRSLRVRAQEIQTLELEMALFRDSVGVR
jgi:hypothetical protein